jgi:type II secretory pathway component PulC
MKFKNILFMVLLVSASVLWIYNISLFVNIRHVPKPAKKAVAGAAVAEKYVYKGDFSDPFFCMQFMPGKQGPSGSVAHGRKKKEETITLPSCKIGGIVYNASNPMAIFISGGKSQLVKQGDVIDSITIKKIFSDSVEVTFKAKKFYLKK